MRTLDKKTDAVPGMRMLFELSAFQGPVGKPELSVGQVAWGSATSSYDSGNLKPSVMADRSEYYKKHYSDNKQRKKETTYSWLKKKKEELEKDAE